MSCFITGSGAALPPRVVTNAELASPLGVTAEWIEAKSGIRERRWVNAGQSASDLATMAVEAALNDADLKAGQLDYLIGGTLSPDYQVPGIAPLVQRKLHGCRQIPAMDLRAACAAILYSLQIGRSLIASGAASTVACFGAEAQSKGLDLHPRSAELSMLFGDGAGAFVLSHKPLSAAPALCVEDIVIASDGNFAEDLCVRSPGTANGAGWFAAEHQENFLHLPLMNGRNVILHAVRKLTEAATTITARNHLSVQDIDLIIPHQANANLLKSLAVQLKFPEEKIVSNVAQYGNTSGASAFIALHQAKREGWLPPGGRILIVAFGAGFTWGAALCRVVDR